MSRLLNLDQPARYRVHLSVCQNALKVWQSYVDGRRRIRYADSVVGGQHEVDKLLPRDALDSAKRCEDVASIEERYREPIAAMQDLDIEFPKHITYAYYAIYNLFEKYALGKDIDDWLIVNQALAAQENTADIAAVLEHAIVEAE